MVVVVGVREEGRKIELFRRKVNVLHTKCIFRPSLAPVNRLRSRVIATKE
jgi:hypothetical protein